MADLQRNRPSISHVIAKIEPNLGETHVAYQCSDFPLINVSVVGGRAFSCGGEQLYRKRLLSARYGVESMDGSARRIHKAALGASEDHFLILLAHNGPTGLGSDITDICDKDWVFGGGDHGDPGIYSSGSHSSGIYSQRLGILCRTRLSFMVF